MKIDIDKFIENATKKMEVNAVRLSKALVKLRNILLLLIATIAGIYLIKNESTRIWGVVIFILSFGWLYSYVVKRRGTRKK